MQPAIGPWSNVVRHGPRVDAQSSAAVPISSRFATVLTLDNAEHRAGRCIQLSIHDSQRSRRWAMLASRRLFAKFLAGCALSLLAITSGVPVAASEDSEVRCLALTIYFEARGESELGQLAVGHVVMNRTRDADFPRTVCGVVQQGGEARNRCQFSWWCDGLSDRPRDKSALLASLVLAIQIYHGCSNDPTAGALWYHTSEVRPAWSAKFGHPQKIGAHVFYRGEPDKQRLTKAFATANELSAECSPASYPAKKTEVAAR